MRFALRGLLFGPRIAGVLAGWTEQRSTRRRLVLTQWRSIVMEHTLPALPYAPDALARAAPRLLLHATALAFEHPADGRRRSFGCPAPF